VADEAFRPRAISLVLAGGIVAARRVARDADRRGAACRARADDLTGTGLQSFASALVMLGVGWNFLYIGGTTLLTSTYTAAERARAQAANDMSIFVVGLLSSLSAGGPGCWRQRRRWSVWPGRVGAG